MSAGEFAGVVRDKRFTLEVLCLQNALTKRFSWAEWENTKQRSRILFTSSMYNSIFLIFPYLGKVKSKSNWTEELGVCVVCCLVLKAGSAQTTLQAQSVRPHRLIHSSISRCWSVFHIWMNGIRTAWGHAPPWKFFGSSLTKIADDDVSPYHFEKHSRSDITCTCSLASLPMGRPTALASTRMPPPERCKRSFWIGQGSRKPG